MKRLLLVIAIVVTNLALSSCSYEDAADNEALYETQGTEGEDGHIIPPEEPGD